MNLLNRLFLLLLCFVALNAAAQLPADLSNVRSSQITDAQLQRIMTQAQSSGLTPQQLETELLRRGLPQQELAELKQRMEMLGTGTMQDVDGGEGDTSSVRSSRTGPRIRNNPPNKETLEASLKRSRIFGSELFANTNLSFEPDLRMATPKNYVIGPDDELLLNVYGVNLSQQNLKVSPEGTVNVKYAGIIPVAGLTIEAATAAIRSRLLRYYPGLSSGQTRLSVTLGNIRSIRVILIGAINRPGTYTLPSLATLFNALYVSGGPAENGSFRNIELIRGNKVITTADLYDFLQKGDLKGNLHLEDNDVIRVPYAQKLITLNGELNRPGIFELQAGESLQQALNFAGGFKSKAFKGRITGNRYAGIGRQVLDIAGDSLQFFQPLHGDEFNVDSVINRYQNRVMITGAVFKPGAYALDAGGTTLKQLIGKAQGLKEDVYSGRALVVRTRDDLSKEYVSVELKPIIAGGQDGLVLRRDDSIHVASIFDLRDTTSVSINGAVRKPGTFRFEEGLSLKSLIIKAEGFSDNATGMGIEISRRKRNVDISKAGSDIVEIIRVDDTKELSNSSNDVVLQPFDIVTIKEDPFYKKQISVKVSGEVLMPAVYTLQSREERLSSLIRRSGGLLYTANVGGAKLIRQKKVEVDTSEVKRLFATVERDTLSAAKKVDQVAKNTTEVAINLKYILKNPGSTDDITLEEGDELIIPRINNTVSVNGEVFKPVDIMYERGKKLSDYLSDAGGVTQRGKRYKAFVIYPNGGSAKTRRVLGIFPKAPKIQPGSSIFVPQKPERQGFDVAKAGIFLSAVTAMITAVSLLAR